MSSLYYNHNILNDNIDISNISAKQLLNNIEEHNNYSSLICIICKYSTDIELIKKCLSIISNTEECKYFIDEILEMLLENKLFAYNNNLKETMKCLFN